MLNNKRNADCVNILRAHAHTHTHTHTHTYSKGWRGNYFLRQSY